MKKLFILCFVTLLSITSCEKEDSNHTKQFNLTGQWEITEYFMNTPRYVTMILNQDEHGNIIGRVNLSFDFYETLTGYITDMNHVTINLNINYNRDIDPIEWAEPNIWTYTCLMDDSTNMPDGLIFSDSIYMGTWSGHKK